MSFQLSNERKPKSPAQQNCGSRGNLWPGDAVWEFAKTHDLFPYLEMGLQWVREFFPTACNFSLEYVIDPEVEGYSWIELRFYVSGTVEEVFQQYRQLNQKRTQHIPFDKSDMIGVIFGWME